MKRVRLASSHGGGVEEMDDAYQRAKQYYDELLMKTMENKRLLHRVNRKKRTLEAEVRFLRQRYAYLMSIQTPIPPKQALRGTQVIQEAHREEVLPMERIYRDREALPMERSYRDREVLSTERSFRDRDAALQNSGLDFDLNQISTEEIEIQNIVEPLPAEKNLMKFHTSRLGKPPLPPRQSNIQLSNDLKFSVCRDIGKGYSQTGKRKISWQDPVALRV